MNNDPIFIDTNIPMYAAGKNPSYCQPCQQSLAIIVEKHLSVMTDCEVHQEILHRYLSLGLPEKAKEMSEDFERIVPSILPITMHDVQKARQLLVAYSHVRARDLLHVAVMLNNGLHQILSVDSHFATFHEIRRIDPVEFVAMYQEK